MYNANAHMNERRAVRRWGTIVFSAAALAITGGVGVARATSPAGATAYVPINPCRLIDTRSGTDNVGGRTDPLGADEALTLGGDGDQGNCSGAAALPGDATGLQLNVTAVGATLPTFLTLYPSGGTRPTASHLNPTPGGAAVPNAVTVKLDDAGRFDVFNRFGQVHLIIDVVGFYTDHHHDDRYYTRDDIDAGFYTRQEIDALTTPTPWRIEIPASAVTMQSSDLGVWATRSLSSLEFATLQYEFRLPDDYRAGVDLVIEFMVTGPGGEACGLSLVTSLHTAYGGGEVLSVPVSFVDPTPAAVRHDVDVPAADAGRTLTDVITVDGTELEPGDWVKGIFGRGGGFAFDTCPGTTFVGLTVQQAP